MKKEVLVAVLIGLTMGLVITYGFYRVKTNVTTPKTTQEVVPDLDGDQQSISSLSLHSPEDGLVQTDSEVTIAGTTLPSTFVVVFVNDKEQITTADESGNFSVEADLETGANVITVIVADNDGNTYSENRTVVVSDLLDSDEQQTASDSASTKTNDETP